MQIRNLLIIFLFCFTACKSKSIQHEEKFDKTKWDTKIGKQYPYRDEMLKDLMTNHLLKTLKRNEVINLLGAPTRSDSSYLFYIVAQEFIDNILPLHTKSLVIKFHKDSTVEWVKIHE
jgi:hypothetical protein